MHLLYRLPQSKILLYDANNAFKSRSALISEANNLYSLPVHSVSRRHASIFVPHVVSVSTLHFVKSLPHLFFIHARNVASHAF